MTERATGTFKIALTSQTDAASAVGRMSISKRFVGDIVGTSSGEMLAVRSVTTRGSAGYVTIEQVVGTVHGKSGTFFLQHSGFMDRGVPELSVSVVPDTGTGELIGLSGRMSIDAAADHAYQFDYEIKSD